MMTRTPLSSGSAAICRVASSPSVPGMRMSISTTSARSERARSTAAAPSAASPTTSMPGAEPAMNRLFGWLLLALLERRTPHARRPWTTIALAALATSLALPLTAATTTSAATGLIMMHLTVGAAVIPAMAHTARTR